MNDTRHIQEEIKSISPLLDQLRSIDSMKNMEQLFVDTESDIMNAIQFDSNNNQVLSELYSVKLSYQHCFSLPENYFAHAEQAIILKVKEHHHPAKVISFKKVFRYSVAACVIMLLGLPLVRYYNNTQQKEITLSDSTIIKEIDSLPESEVVGYLQDSGTDVEAALVASVSEEENLPSEEEILLNEDIFTNLSIPSSHQSTNQKSSL